MKAYWIKHDGQNAALELRELPVPEPGPGQLVMRVRAASLNRGDLLGAIAHHRSVEGRPAGVDGAGEVHALGEGVRDFKPGERIMARSRGCFAEYVLVDPKLASRVPDRLTWEEAGAIPISYVTAWEALIQFGRLQAGETVLIAGASSGVGVCSIQLAKVRGAKVIGVSTSEQKLGKLRALGMDIGIHARAGDDFSAQVLQANGGKGVDVAVNLVGGTVFAACQRSLADFGRLVIVGYVDGVMKAEIDLEAIHTKRLEVVGISNAPLTPAMRAEATVGLNRDVLPAIADGRIQPVIDRVFPFDELSAAKAYVETGAHIGKVVIRMP
ncbi:MAG TPA: zinc-binding dehydrogenase [Burkholderiales bacterium]|nr:zinc-binding dehydrogenase [Burkholderiales bacterium]